MSIYILLTVVITICSLLYAYFQNGYKYWEKRGFPYLEPKFPKGNSKKFLTLKKNLGLETSEFYDEIKRRSWKFGGVYTVLRPVLIVVDPDIIGDILVRDFNHFVDRGTFYNEKTEPMSAHLFNLESNAWRNMRVKLTPTFTSGKIKMMFNNIFSHSKSLVEVIDQHVSNKKDIDIKNLSANFTTDAIGSCAFGLDMKSFDENEAKFRKYGRIFSVPEGIFHILRLTMCAISPNVFKALGLKYHRKDCTEFFTNLVKQTVEYRNRNGISRPDFLQLLIDMKNDGSLTTDQIVAQVYLFFVAGFDTSSSAMTFVLYELAKQPELQDRLRNEINEVLAKYNDEITYDSIKEITYLQQVLDDEQNSLAFQKKIKLTVDNLYSHHSLSRFKDERKKMPLAPSRPVHFEETIGEERPTSHNSMNNHSLLVGNQAYSTSMAVAIFPSRESLRIYPPLYNIMRKCVKDYKIRNTDLVIEKGTCVAIPIMNLHRDPEYYPDPLKFDPERFTMENKSKLRNFVHLPFGDGPRNCIGLRFGLTQTKTGLIEILRNFRISISPSTKMPLTLSEKTFLINTNETLYLKAERIKKN